jgi:flavin reductase (DIM6/NTAB) family NADH-FMN oxidoreductase RutF
MRPATAANLPDAGQFRRVLGHFPTGVAAITARDENGAPVGMTVGSFTSVSLDPLLVALLPDKNSGTFPKIRAAGSFCVNVLGEDQERVCRSFAAKGVDKFLGVQWRAAGSGSPIIDGVVAWIDCDIETFMTRAITSSSSAASGSLRPQETTYPCCFKAGMESFLAMEDDPRSRWPRS